MRPFFLTALAITALGSLLAAQGPAAGEEPLFSPAQWQQLRAGQVVLSEAPSASEGEGLVQAAIIVPSPPWRVWPVMVDCAAAPRWVPGLEECRVLGREADGEVIMHRVDASWFLPEVAYVFRARYQKPWRISFERLRGDLDEMRGPWQMRALDQGRGTLVVYSVFLDPGFWVPQWLVNLTLEADLPELLLALRRRVAALTPGGNPQGPAKGSGP